MFKKTLLVSTAALSLVLTACNDPKEANKENFGKAISEYLDTQSAVCLRYPSGSHLKLPDDSPLKNKELVIYSTSENLKSLSYKKEIDQMTYFVQKGLFTEQEQMAKVKDLWGELLEVPVKVYSPTETLKSYLMKKDEFSPKICTGKVTLSEVGTFTEPADAMGMKVSKVEYTVKTSDLAEWATDPKFAELFTATDAKRVESQQRMALILTSEGWKSEHLMKGKR